MPFEIFESYGAREKNYLTLRTTNFLFIRKGILKDLNLEDSKFAEFYIDRANLNIALKLVKELPIVRHRKIVKERSGLSVNIGPILKHFGIMSVNKKIDSHVKHIDGMLVFSIKELVEANK